MRATSIGHAGILIETAHGSILCDPWFVPAFFGSWFVFPRNDQLSDELRDKIEHPDFLYVSHLHGDHLDEAFLAEHVSRDTTVLVPGFPTHELERRMQALGFRNVLRTVDQQEQDLGGITVAIHVETSITDGPGGDSALVVSDGTARLVNQNDCRTHDLDALRSHGPVDVHWLQYSGAIWYPMVYEESPERMRELCDSKVESQFARAMRYVEHIGARYIVPSAGPPAFLDPELARFNVVTGDELSIFPDQRAFLTRLDSSGFEGILAIPGTVIEITAPGGQARVEHPMPDDAVERIFTHKAEYLAEYAADWAPLARAGEGRLGGAGRRPVRPVEGVVGTAAGARPHAADRRRSSRPAAHRRPRAVDRLPGRRGAPLRRGGPPLPVRHPAGAGRDRGRATCGRLVQRAVPLVPVPGVA